MCGSLTPSPAALQVIPPEEINVSFDDIGALEAVKNTLHEVRAAAAFWSLQRARSALSQDRPKV